MTSLRGHFWGSIRHPGGAALGGWVCYFVSGIEDMDANFLSWQAILKSGSGSLIYVIANTYIDLGSIESYGVWIPRTIVIDFLSYHPGHHINSIEESMGAELRPCLGS